MENLSEWKDDTSSDPWRIGNPVLKDWIKLQQESANEIRDCKLGLYMAQVKWKECNLQIDRIEKALSKKDDNPGDEVISSPD